MTRKQQRMTFVFGGLAMLGLAVAISLFVLRDTITFFYDPTDVTEGKVEVGRSARLGGLVEEGSVQRLEGTTIQFRVTDLDHTVPVVYTGLLPDLFREGQGVVAEGKLDGKGTFQAASVLAKHDENYMPAEVAESLKKSGQWKPES